METLDNPSGSTNDVVSTGKAKRYIAAAALLTGGLTVGAFLSPIGLADAQTDDATTSESETDATTTSESEENGHRRHRGGAHLDEMTALLGVDADELRTRLHDGESLAVIAEAEGVSTDALVAGLVEAMEARLDEAVANDRMEQAEADEILDGAEARIEELINRTPGEGDGEGRLGRGDQNGRRGHGGGVAVLEGAGLEELLGLSSDDIRAGLADGQSLAQIAETAGVATDELIGAIVESANDRIDAAVEAGRIDADRGAELEASTVERATDMVNRTREDDGLGRFGGGHRGSNGPGGAADGADSEVQESSYTA